MTADVDDPFRSLKEAFLAHGGTISFHWYTAEHPRETGTGYLTYFRDAQAEPIIVPVISYLRQDYYPWARMDSDLEDTVNQLEARYERVAQLLSDPLLALLVASP